MLAAAVVVTAWTVVVLLAVRGDLRDAQSALERVREQADVSTAGGDLQQAQDDLQRSADRLGQPGPALFARVPLAGRTVRTVQRTTAAVLAVTASSREVLALVEDGPPLLVAGRVDLARLAVVQDALATAGDRTAGPVAALAAQELGLVPGVVAGPARTAQGRLRTVPADLARAATGLQGLREVLGADGPRSFLVLLENNAELRATGGIVTVFAEATAEDGRLELAAFQDVEDVFDLAATARRVPAPADFVRLYGDFKADTTLFRNSNMSPDVPTSSQVVAEAARATTGRRPDVVLWLDVPTIAALLRATGPAPLPDGTVLRADDAVTRLLSTAYEDAPDTPDGQAQRREQLRAAADAVVGRLLGGGSADTSPVALARELSTAARGRHLKLWAADPTTQDRLRAAGIAGGVAADGGDLSALTVHNLGGGDDFGNKLDFYARRQVTVDVALDRDGAVVTQELSLRNTAPSSGLPTYVAGQVEPGVSNSFVTVSLPREAQDVAFERGGRGLSTDVLPEGDHVVLTDVVSLPPGTATTWRLRYRLPLQDGRYALHLVPQPLAVDAGLAVTLRAAAGLELQQDSLDGAPGGTAALSGPFDVVRVVQARAVRPGLLRRAGSAISRFWSSPVSLG